MIEVAFKVHHVISMTTLAEEKTAYQVINKTYIQSSIQILQFVFKWEMICEYSQQVYYSLSPRTAALNLYFHFQNDTDISSFNITR